MTGRIPRDRGQRVRAIGRGAGIPIHGIRRTEVFGIQVDAVQLELHPDHPDIVRSVGGDANRAAQVDTAVGSGDADQGRGDIGCRLVNVQYIGVRKNAVIYTKIIK